MLIRKCVSRCFEPIGNLDFVVRVNVFFSSMLWIFFCHSLINWWINPSELFQCIQAFTQACSYTLSNLSLAWRYQTERDREKKIEIEIECVSFALLPRITHVYLGRLLVVAGATSSLLLSISFSLAQPKSIMLN